MKKIHKVCHMLKRHQAVYDEAMTAEHARCKECPARVKLHGHGYGTRGCYLAAREFMNIVQFGNPWGKKHRWKTWPKKLAKTAAK